MASEEDHTVYGEEDLDEDDDEEVSEEEDHDLTLTNHPPLDDDDDEDEDDSISSAAGEVTIAVAGAPIITTITTAAAAVSAVQSSSIISLPDLKLQLIDDAMIATTVEEKKPMPLDESRKLFQRLWTDEDEIGLLQGFLDYTTSRGPTNSSHHHDTTAFYDQVKNKLQLDFNKNQLVEKLRRLKKKYRNVLSKISLGKEYVFKSPHDQATFEISCKIWSGLAAGGSGAAPTAAGVEGTGLDDEEANANPYSNSTPNLTFNLNDDNNNNGFVPNSSEKKVPRSRKRARGGVKIEEISPQPQVFNEQPEKSVAASIPNLVEETVKTGLSPLFKELFSNAVNGSYASRGFGGVNLSRMPLGFGGSLNYSGGDVVDEKWRKQHISELEVYSKRLELVQEEIKLQLEELRSMTMRG